MRSILVPDEIVPQVEGLVEIYLRDRKGDVWTYAVESVKGLLHVLEKQEAEKRRKLFEVKP